MEPIEVGRYLWGKSGVAVWYAASVSGFSSFIDKDEQSVEFTIGGKNLSVETLCEMMTPLIASIYSYGVTDRLCIDLRKHAYTEVKTVDEIIEAVLPAVKLLKWPPRVPT